MINPILTQKCQDSSESSILQKQKKTFQNSKNPANWPQPLFVNSSTRKNIHPEAMNFQSPSWSNEYIATL